MMQNDEFDDVIKMVNKNHEKFLSYKLQKNESLRIKEARRLKKIKGIIIKSAVGVIIVSSLTTLITNTTDKSIAYQNNEYAAMNIIDNNEETNTDDIKTIVVLKTEEQKLLKKYCNDVYNVNYSLAYNLASKLTNNFKSEEYLKTNNPSFKINQKNANNKEHGIILFLRHLYQKPEDFGLSRNDIKNKDYIPSNKGNEEYKVKYYSDLFGIEPELVLAIQYHEANWYKSDAYMNYNNPAGLMTNNGLWNFNSPDEGIIEHIYQLKKNYIDKGYTTPKEIKKIYAPDNAKNDPYNLNQFWEESVESILKDIKNNKDIFNMSEIKNNDVNKITH